MICNTANAIALLFDNAVDNLSNDQLEFLSGLAESAADQANSVAKQLNRIANELSEEDIEWSKSDLALSLWSLEESLKTASSAICVSHQAAAELKKRGQ